MGKFCLGMAPTILVEVVVVAPGLVVMVPRWARAEVALAVGVGGPMANMMDRLRDLLILVVEVVERLMGQRHMADLMVDPEL
jgi:hypothetical protein